VKVLAGLDIAEHRRPQDGRIAFDRPGGGEPLDVRVSLLPTVEGEGAVLRLLERSRRPPTLTEIGLPNAHQMRLERLIQNARGALLVTGPTGSGKSTTVYAALADVRTPDVNVVTVEDPVELRLPGAYQVEVNPRADVTFARALRSVLRSDPDVVMVGEIRDAETAAIAVQAALTGHFVLSTLHTSDAPGALVRLTDMGVEPYLTASAVTAVLAQRLARRLCEHCREAYEPDAAELVRLGFPAGAVERLPDTLYRPRGCDACHRGYRGRTGIFQLLVLDDELRALAGERAPAARIAAAAEASGMESLLADGLRKAGEGITSLQELRRALTV
jgi:type II secretory ATPase GspE/PulE/Tfp pilus assembly ATPase PilB-like protein